MRGSPTWRRVKRSGPRATKGLETSGAIAYGTIVPRCIVNCAVPVNWRSVLTRRITRAGAYAEDQTARGEFPPQARHWAIRVELLDSERDWAWIAQHRNGAPVHAGTALFLPDGRNLFIRTRGDSPKKHPAGLGGRHQLTYEYAWRRLREDAGESPP